MIPFKRVEDISSLHYNDYFVSLHYKDYFVALHYNDYFVSLHDNDYFVSQTGSLVLTLDSSNENRIFQNYSILLMTGEGKFAMKTESFRIILFY